MRRIWSISTCLLAVYLGLASTTPANGLPPVHVNLSHTSWTGVGGDTLTNELLPYEPGWAVHVDVIGVDPVTGPRVEFTSDGSFVEFWPPPTGLVAPSTTVWDYPGRSLVPGERPLHLNAEEAGYVATPGFTATRAVDTPLLVAPVTTQTVDLTVRFDALLAGHLNSVGVQIGGFEWDPSAIHETVLSQNVVAGWTAMGNGWWNIDPAAIVVGTPYAFQAEVQCTKQPGFEGATIYHKPQAFVSTAEWKNLPQQTGTGTSLVHPEGETAQVSVNETATWNRGVSTGGQDAFIESVTLQVDQVSMTVEKINTYYGREHDGQGNYVGHGFHVEALGHNIVAAEMTTPTGRTWHMMADEDEGGVLQADFEIDAECLSPADLAALGMVPGTYGFTFHGASGELLTTSVDAAFETPTQIPNLLDPVGGQQGVPVAKIVSWDSVTDPDVDGIFLDLEEAVEGPCWELWAEELPPGVDSWPVAGMPADADIECMLAFAVMEGGVTPEGVPWRSVGYTNEFITFRTAPEPATLAFLGLGLAAFAVRRRSGTRRSGRML